MGSVLVCGKRCAVGETVMAEFNETVIDHVGTIFKSDDWCGVSTGEVSVKNTLKRLAEKYPDEVECIAENSDGSVYYHVPWDWVAIRKPKQMHFTDEQIEQYRKTMKEKRAKQLEKV